MADTANIKAKKYNSRIGQFTDISFLASKHVDGYCYFNDDFYYRCKPNGIDLQIFDPLNNIWVPSNKIYPQTIDNVDVSKIINMGEGLVNVGIEVTNIINGSGSVASNASVENAVLWMIEKSRRTDITYDYTIDSARDTNSHAYNCSTFIITAFWQAGFPINSAVNTFTMRNDFENAGFIWHPTSGPVYATQLKRGDILLWNIYNPMHGHTQCYIGDNQDVNAGDVRPKVQPHCIYCYSDIGTFNWDGFLRYNE